MAESSSGLSTNPKMGRFLTQDDIGGDNWTNNLYSYCGNNTVSFKDLTGYDCTFAAMVKAY